MEINRLVTNFSYLKSLLIVRNVLLITTGFLLLIVIRIELISAAPIQQINFNEAIKAVVRIMPQRCSSTGCQPLSVGSGTIIHPAGIILTAWHVTVADPENLITPVYADDFIIEMTEDVRRRPRPRYRAELIAVKPDMDLALLRIYQEIETNQPIALHSSNNLPTLPISDNIPSSGQLRIMGYPPAGGDSIKYPNLEMSGFADDGALLTVQGTLSEGYSGGPVLYEQDGRLAIVGIVIRRRGELGEVGLIRSIDQLRRLEWLPNATRVWGENGQVTIGQNSGNSILQIQLNLHTLDFIEEHGRLLAYAFDATTGQPWMTNESSFERRSNGHLVLQQEFSATSIVQQTTVTLLSGELDEQYNQLAFKLLLWDTDETRVLWRDNQWYHPQVDAAQVALVSTPTPVPTSTSIKISTPTATETKMVIQTNTPTPTNTSSSTSTPTNAPRSTSTTIPTEPQSAMQQVTPIQSSRSTHKGEIIVGSKEFSEQLILGKMYVLLLRNAGYRVKDKTSFGPSPAVRSALENGEIDLYPEYTGTAAALYYNLPVSALPSEEERLFALVKSLDEDSGLVWLNRASANNTFSLIVRLEIMNRGIQSVQDLANYMNNNNSPLKVCVETEFFSRQDGLIGLQALYDFQFKEENILVMGPSETYDHLRDGTCEVAEGFTTDGRIFAWGFHNLKDPLSFFPIYNPAPVIRRDILTVHPELENLLGSLGQYLDTNVMMQLNARVDLGPDGIIANGDEETPEDVARDFLIMTKLLNAP
ncbi:MAG: glycine betaine ABC transporter substrate-binding protein [Caldilineaceae bacterium]